MRIIHVISSIDPRAGGTTKALLDLARAQASIGLNVQVISSRSEGETPEENQGKLEAAGVAVKLVGPGRGRFLAHSDNRSSVAGVLGSDVVVHIHALWEDIQHQAAIACRQSGTPYIWMPHGMLDPWSLAQSKWKKRVVMAWRTRRDLKHASAIAFTNEIERDLVARLHLPGIAIVEPLGLDFAEFNDLPARGLFRAKFPQIGQKRIVLFLSRVHPKKGLDLLIPAFATVAKPDDVLVIAGPVAAGYQPVIDGLINTNGLQSRVVLTGMLHGRDRLAAMVDAAVFVLPSYQENFGIAVAEAVAAGCPTIISDQVNIWKELQESGSAGVTRAQLAPLTELLKTWLDNDQLREAFARRGKIFAHKRYDWNRIATNWAGYYRDVLAANLRP